MARNYKHFSAGIALVPQDGSLPPSAGGDLAAYTSDGKVHFFNGSVGTSSPWVTEAHPSTLTNKTMDGTQNTFSNIPFSAILGINSVSAHAVVVGQSASSFGSVSPGSSAFPLVSTGASTNPAFQLLTVAGGGIGLASISAHALLVGNTTSAPTQLPPGSTNLPLVSNGASSDPSYQVLPIAGGGTGQTSANSAFNALAPTTTKGDSIVSNGSINVREAVGSNGQVLLADSTSSTGRSWNNPQSIRNLCINSGPDVWQLGTSTVCGPAASTYVTDQWYLKTAGASPFAVTATQQTGTFGKWALKAIVSTASNGSGNAFEMTTVLENRDMLQIYNQNASFSAQIKAFGNVTQVGLQFLSATSEIKPTTTIGSEVLVTVNTGGYTLCSINGQAMGTGATTAGVIGVRIRPTAVSSGNIWDLNNGFQMEQAVINLGPVPIPYSKTGSTYAEEILMCQRFFCKTFNLDTAPAQNAGTVGALGGVGQVANQAFCVYWKYPAEMRVTPTITTYSTNAASSNWSTNTTTPTATTNSTQGSSGTVIEGTTSVTASAFYTIHASADARI